MQTFFTSDTHFDDEFAMRYFQRPFQSVDEMNAVMVEQWNRVVADDDLVYHLGDFTPEDLSHFTKWADQLCGKIRIVPGNMDRLWLKDFAGNDRVQVMAPLVSNEAATIASGWSHATDRKSTGKRVQNVNG